MISILSHYYHGTLNPVSKNATIFQVAKFIINEHEIILWVIISLVLGKRQESFWIKEKNFLVKLKQYYKNNSLNTVSLVFFALLLHIL